MVEQMPLPDSDIPPSSADPEGMPASLKPEREHTPDPGEHRGSPGRERIPPYIVGIGASAGGLEALERFFDALPADTGLAYVVVQHLSPDYKSLMVELLSKRTPMHVCRVENGMRVEPDTVYLIPPKQNMLICNGALLLTEQGPRHSVNLPIDLFFQSLAEDCHERAIGIVLSGTGSDGMRGLRTLKDMGGLALVQDPATSRFDGMPRSAISTGLVDLILPPESMPSHLIRYTAPRRWEEETDGRTTREPHGEDQLARILSILRKQSGMDFSFYKDGTVFRRIERRMKLHQTETLQDYAQLLLIDPREAASLQKELLIGVTSFFRDPESWEALRRETLPFLFKNAKPGQPLRAWVAGCSTGEEAYTLALCLAAHVEAEGLQQDFKVFATDIDRHAVDIASQGLYPESIAADVPAPLLERYFESRTEGYRIRRAIRESVVFASHNLLQDPPFTNLDLITCRNLLIYLQPPVQKKVLSLFAFALRKDGHLFLGSSEALGSQADLFTPIDQKAKIWRSVTVAHRPLSGTLETTSMLDRIQDPYAARFAPARRRQRDAFSDTCEISQTLIEEYLPPCVLVNDQYEILHVFGNVAPFLRLASGKPTLHLLDLVIGDLSKPLAAVLHQAVKKKSLVIYRKVEANDWDGMPITLHLKVHPLAFDRMRRHAYAVFFETSDHRPRTGEEGQGEREAAEPASESERIQDLEKDLLHSRENLQATVEELESSNEELQATNEELLSSNEELQSTNEELQSVNEELYTVNAEYQNKIHELTELGNDIDSLLDSLEVGALFLDKELRVRKFTSGIDTFVNVMPQDIGRPFQHLTHHLHEVDLHALVVEAHTGHRMIEQSVRMDGDISVRMRIAPYNQNREPESGGVVITFVKQS